MKASSKHEPYPLYDLLLEAELTGYFSSLKSRLKVQHAEHLGFVKESDLAEIGMSKPEMRRLWKIYHKRCPAGLVGKLKKRMLSRMSSTSNTTDDGSKSDRASLASRRSSVETEHSSEQHIIPPNCITLCKQLGSGEFGTVWQGVWSPVCGQNKLQVAVKCVSAEKLQANPLDFIQEAAIMHRIAHPHIVRLYGVVLDTKSIMLVNELAPLRSLAECLRESGLQSSFPVLRLCAFAEQICAGMVYLESNRLIHRDLAARNILVFSKDKIKISDFGLSRALGVGEEYYRSNFSVTLKLPIAWCAPECVNFLKFTSASDVWAFGVTLWELFTYGFQPWAGLTGHQILEAVDVPRGQRLETPDACPADHYHLMRQCWRHDPAARPRFADLAAILPDIQPERVQTIQACEDGQPDHLQYAAGQILTVLDKRPKEYPDGYYWKGVSESGRTGLFVPTNTVSFIGSDCPQLPLAFSKQLARSSSTGLAGSTQSLRSTVGKAANSAHPTPVPNQKLNRHMISGPQGDVRHTGHVGIDGSCFGEISFLDKSRLPQQIVPPLRFTPETRSASSSPQPPSTSTLSRRPPKPEPAIAGPADGVWPVTQTKAHLVPQPGRFPIDDGCLSQGMNAEVTRRSDEVGGDTRSILNSSFPDLDTPEFESETASTGRSLMDEVFEALHNAPIGIDSSAQLTPGPRDAKLSSTTTEEPTSPTSLHPLDTTDTTQLINSVRPGAQQLPKPAKPEALVRPLSYSDARLLADMTDMAQKLSQKALQKEEEQRLQLIKAREQREREELERALLESRGDTDAQEYWTPPLGGPAKGVKKLANRYDRSYCDARLLADMTDMAQKLSQKALQKEEEQRLQLIKAREQREREELERALLESRGDTDAQEYWTPPLGGPAKGVKKLANRYDRSYCDARLLADMTDMAQKLSQKALQKEEEQRLQLIKAREQREREELERALLESRGDTDAQEYWTPPLGGPAKGVKKLANRYDRSYCDARLLADMTDMAQKLSQKAIQKEEEQRLQLIKAREQREREELERALLESRGDTDAQEYWTPPLGGPAKGVKKLANRYDRSYCDARLLADMTDMAQKLSQKALQKEEEQRLQLIKAREQREREELERALLESRGDTDAQEYWTPPLGGPAKGVKKLANRYDRSYCDARLLADMTDMAQKLSQKALQKEEEQRLQLIKAREQREREELERALLESRGDTDAQEYWTPPLGGPAKGVKKLANRYDRSYCDARLLADMTDMAQKLSQKALQKEEEQRLQLIKAREQREREELERALLESRGDTDAQEYWTPPLGGPAKGVKKLAKSFKLSRTGSGDASPDQQRPDQLGAKPFSAQLPKPDLLTGTEAWSPEAENAYKSLVECGRSMQNFARDHGASDMDATLGATSDGQQEICELEPQPAPDFGGVTGYVVPTEHPEINEENECSEEDSNPLRRLRRDAGGIARSFKPIGCSQSFANRGPPPTLRPKPGAPVLPFNSRQQTELTPRDEGGNAPEGGGTPGVPVVQKAKPKAPPVPPKPPRTSPITPAPKHSSPIREPEKTPELDPKLDFTIESVDKYELLDFVLAALDKDSPSELFGSPTKNDSSQPQTQAKLHYVELAGESESENENVNQKSEQNTARNNNEKHVNQKSEQNTARNENDGPKGTCSVPLTPEFAGSSCLRRVELDRDTVNL